MSTNPRTMPVLFLSGAGLGPWIWDDVRAALPVDSVVAAYPKRTDATLPECAAAALDQAPSGQFVIVAHSIGGVVAGQLAATAPERIGAVLGIAASFPAAGSSFLADFPVPQRILLGLVLRVAGTRPPDKAIRSGLCGGLGPDVAARVVAAFEPESPHLYRDRLSPFTFPAHRGYVATTADRQLAAARQHAHASELGAGWRRELPTGHLPMLQNPTHLATIIQEFTADAK